MLRIFFLLLTLIGSQTLVFGQIDAYPDATNRGLSKIDDFVDLTKHRKDHILNRHRAGAGKAGKTEFPSGWSDDRILHQVSDIATDPNATRGVGKWNSPYAIEERERVRPRILTYLATSLIKAQRRN